MEYESEESKKFGVLDKLMSGEINKEEKDILIVGLENRIAELKKEYKSVNDRDWET